MPETELRRLEPAATAAMLYNRYQCEPLRLTIGAISVQAEEADIDRRALRGVDVSFPGDPQTVRGARVTYNVPYTGERTLLELRPSQWSSRIPSAMVTDSELRFAYDVPSPQVAETKVAFERDLALTRTYVDSIRHDLQVFHPRLAECISSALTTRMARLDEAAEGLAALGLPVRRTATVGVDAHLAPQGAHDPSTRAARPQRFDVALSFAGEDREYVGRVAEHLRANGLTVFYDGFEAVELWGRDLIEHLQHIYQNDAKFCVLFVSSHYVEKPWPRHEARSAMARALVVQDEYLLPARFDDSILPGLPTSLNFVDLRRIDERGFAKMILTKVGTNRPGA